MLLSNPDAKAAHPLDISYMTQEGLNAELEKGYADIRAGRVRPVEDVLADIEKTMMYELWTAEAEKDLRGIFEYIAFDLQSVQNAVGQLERLERGIVSLDHMPERFQIYEKEPWRRRNLRTMPVDNYLVFYMVNQEKRIVTIMRVMYGRRDIGR